MAGKINPIATLQRLLEQAEKRELELVAEVEKYKDYWQRVCTDMRAASGYRVEKIK